MLDAVGGQAAEWRIYRLLVRLLSATSAELAGHLDLAADEVSDVLCALERQGAARRDPADSRRYVPVPPDLAFGPELRQRERELAATSAALERLGAEYRDQLALRGSADLIEVVVGEAIGPRVLELQRTAAKEVCAVVKLPTFAFSAAENTVEVDGLRNGVSFRTVYPREVLELEGDPFRLAESVAAGEQGRIAAETPLKMILVDHSVAVVPVLPAPSPEPSALLVYPSGLLDALVALFDSIWLSATPVLATRGGQDYAADAESPSPSDRHLLSLLLAGLTDQAIAAQLGLSMRTVQRRVRAMIELAGVRTRLQLIWQATRRGWLQHPNDR